VALCVATLIFATIGGASASSLGGVTAPGLAGLTMSTSTGAPTVVAYENFTGSNGTNLDNTSTDGGGLTWLADNATWTIQSNSARSGNAVDSVLVVNGSSNDGAVEATIYRNGGTTFDAGLIVNGDSITNNMLYVEWRYQSNGELRLSKKVSDSPTTLGSVTALYPGGPSTAPASIVLRLVSTSTTVTVYLDGVLMISHSLSGAETTLFKNSTHRWVGLTAVSDTTSTFDNWHLDA
jgi:hypothetical protein